MAYTKYQMNLIEIWKPVNNAPCYKVSSFGRVKKDNKIKPPSQGVHYTTISINGHAKLLHILVMEMFVGIRPKNIRILVNHKDRNIKNNRLDNLEYLTHKGNTIHTLLEKSVDPNAYFVMQCSPNLSKQYEDEKRKALKLVKAYNNLLKKEVNHDK